MGKWRKKNEKNNCVTIQLLRTLKGPTNSLGWRPKTSAGAGSLPAYWAIQSSLLSIKLIVPPSSTSSPTSQYVRLSSDMRKLLSTKQINDLKAMQLNIYMFNRKDKICIGVVSYFPSFLPNPPYPPLPRVANFGLSIPWWPLIPVQNQSLDRKKKNCTSNSLKFYFIS